MKWIVLPVLTGPEMTEAAIADCLAMEGTQLLIINQGVEDAFRERLELISEEYPDRVFLWHHEPNLPSLAATWNRALDFVWACGGEEALVINNDVRLHSETVATLRTVMRGTQALFVTAVGVTAEEFRDFNLIPVVGANYDIGQRGGPDFSCFLISKTCHERWRFDEAFIPLYCEDLDYHRRIMLAGHGDKIFSVNLPYLHLAAQSLKQIDPQQRMKLERLIGESARGYYARKWGGPVNAETFYVPFDEPHTTSLWFGGPGPTTPELQAWFQAAAKNPPVEELSRRMLGRTEVVRPQEPEPPHVHAFTQRDAVTRDYVCACGERQSEAARLLDDEVLL